MDLDGNSGPFVAVVHRCQPSEGEISAEPGRLILSGPSYGDAEVRVDQALVCHGEQQRIIRKSLIPVRLVVLRRAWMRRGQGRIAQPQQARIDAVAHRRRYIDNADFLPDGYPRESDVFVRHDARGDPVAVLYAENLVGDLLEADALGGIIGPGTVQAGLLGEFES